MTYDEHLEAAEIYSKARAAYRRREIGDDEYLAARAVWDDNQKEYDKGRV